MIKRITLLLFIMPWLSVSAQNNPFSIEAVKIEGPKVEYTFSEAFQKQELQTKFVDKTENLGWAQLIQKILKDIANGLIPPAKAEEKVDQALVDSAGKATTEEAEEAPEQEVEEEPKIPEPKPAKPQSPGSYGISAGSSSFKKWFDDSLVYAKQWNFPSVTNKYGRTITPEDYLRAIIWIESRGIHKSSSGKLTTSWSGAQGFMQLMPNTARGLGVNGSDPAQNLKGGSKYLKEIFNSGYVSKKTGEEKLIMAACAYNLGPFSSCLKAKWDSFKMNSSIPTETRGYGLKLKMGLGLELTPSEENLIKKFLLPPGKTVAQLADENYSNTMGIAR